MSSHIPTRLTASCDSNRSRDSRAAARNGKISGLALVGMMFAASLLNAIVVVRLSASTPVANENNAAVSATTTNTTTPNTTTTNTTTIDVEQDRSEANQQLRDGNYNDAYLLFRKLCLDSEASSPLTAEDLSNAYRCLQSLGRVHDVDELVESTVAAHDQNWHVLSRAAQLYISNDHSGFLISGEWERGGHRGGGKVANSLDRDYVRSLQLMVQAMPLANVDDNKRDVSRFYMTLSSNLQFYRNWLGSWQMQRKTDLSELPDYEEGYYWNRSRATQGAPVDAEGNPIFYALPSSWEEAISDGERWRWSMAMTVENDPSQLNQIRTQMANFSRQQFGVQTLMQYGWFYPQVPRHSDDDNQDESGTYALHTLDSNETIARLATGIKRFELPDDYNFIEIYRTIVDEPATGSGENSLSTLSQIFEDRRQYPQSAEYWRQSIRDYGDVNDWKKARLDQIEKNWGRFETTMSRPAGEPATVEYRFRNGDEVEFSAHRIDVDQLLADVKSYIRSKPAQLDWNQINIQNLGYRFVNENISKYAEEEVAKWSVELEPRDLHFDKRVTIETPLTDAGAYWVTAKMKDGNTTSIVLWVADTVLAKLQLNGRSLYFVADAVTGEPIERANVEFFGYRQFQILENGRGTNRYDIEVVNFAERTDADGIVKPDPNEETSNFNWLIMARGEGDQASRLAYLGFIGVWHGQYYDAEYRQTKTMFITDRPVYRPGHQVQIKAWMRQAQYDRETESQFAGQTITVRLHDPMGEEVLKKSLTADEYGGIAFDYELPIDAKLGQYSLYNEHGGAIGGNMFRVEEYKKPEYEVTIDAPTEPVALGESITTTINANYYFGAPVTNATVSYKITRTNYEQAWYPYRYWDWCFGPGYWWYCYEYPWYAGYNDWAGCRAPYPWWWTPQSGPPEIVAEQEVQIGPDGTIEVVIDTSIAKELHGDKDHQYTITAEVRDQSRRTIVGQGTVLVSRKPFKVFSWVDRGYYRVGQTVNASFQAQTLDQEPVQGDGTLTLLQITYDAERNPIETPVRQWELNTDVEGEAMQQLAASTAGQYRLSYEVTDAAGHEIEGGYLFTVIGEGFDGRDYRFNQIELIPDKAEYAHDDTVALQINTDKANSTVLLFIRPSNSVYLAPQILYLDGKSTVVEIDLSKKDMPNFFVEAVTVSDGQVHSQTREIIVPPESRVVNVDVTPSNTEYRPGEPATVDIQLTDLTGENVQGTTVVSIYDKSVEYISGGTNIPEIREFFWKWRRQHRSAIVHNLSTMFSYNSASGPGMGDLGVFGGTVVDEIADQEKEGGSRDERRRQDGNMAMRGMAQASAANQGFADADMSSAIGGGGFGGGGGPGLESDDALGSAAPGVLVEPQVRSNFADTALWVGVLETDATGRAQVELDMPENLTTWKINVWAMGHGTRVGSGTVEVVTRKDLLVRMQAPRFFVQKDEVVLSANVHNYLDEAKSVTVRLELDGTELTAIDELVQNVNIPADGEARVDWRVSVAHEGSATIRMFALSDEESDAMEMNFPVYVHGMLKQEAWAGTVRPADESATVNFMIPDERRPEQSRLEVRYSPTLAGAMVDALPYLSSYPYGCTEQTLNRWLPTVITQKILLDMNLDLESIRDKRTNLNAQELGDDQERAQQWTRYNHNPVFDEDEVDRMVKEGLKRLAEMQVSDGGFGWFSGYGEHSWPHTTAVVVKGLQTARHNDVALVPGMLENAIAWLQRHQAYQVQLLQNAENEVTPRKFAADNVDALIYMILVDEDIDNEEMREFLYRDRNHLSVYAKAVFGLALHSVEDQEKLDMIMTNIEQFVVQDAENETAYLRLPESSYWWMWYGDENEANAYYLMLLSRVDPDGVTAPRFVKYLLNNRKHATYWRSTRDTALCVEAFAEYIRQSGEDQPDMVVEIWLDGEKMKEVEINSENLFSFDNKLVLEGDQITSGEHELEIRRQGSGPVYFNAYSINFTLEDFITSAGLEVKVSRKYYKLIPVDADIDVAGSRGQVIEQRIEKYERVELSHLDSLVSGDLVEIELSIESKNDYEYLMFEDMKPAGFEPVDLRSGYVGNEMNAYTEFRDNRVSFFVRSLARGNHSLSYRMRAETPGRFSALPARVEAMYAPELKGNSDEIRLFVTDEEHE